MTNKEKIKQVREAIDHYSYYGGSGGHRNLTIIEALKSYAKQLENGGWRDIESAPKDGTAILLHGGIRCFQNGREGLVEQFNSHGEVCKYHDGRWVTLGEGAVQGFHYQWVESPVHWMPIPQPLKEDE